MREIRVLSGAVADKIAAGEVAERPAAVVKELVENAIDAGASRIDVEIKKGGIEYIRVADNGCGIPSNQVETAFLRHATSKLAEIEDLYRISTMGFRGEALASICAVAEVEVITKTADAEEGICLEMVHGSAAAKESIACGDGTTMIVKNLFANVPARMKFLKKDSTEAGYVSDLLGRIALSRPDIAFKYICDDKEIFATNGDGMLKNAVLKLYGLDHAKALVDVDYTEDNIHISGVIGKPELARGNRTRQTLFVNGRYVKNHVVAKVVEEAYRNTIMIGRFPFFIINVTLPSELVDVNVHPAKTEVKFANEKQIYDVSYHAVRNAIYKNDETPEDIQAKQRLQKPQNSSSVKKSEVSSGQGVHAAYHKEPPAKRISPAVIKEYLENTIPKKQIEEPHNCQTSLKEPFKASEKLLDELLEQTNVRCERQGMFIKESDGVSEKSLPETEQMSLPEIEDIAGTEQKEEAKIIGQVFDTYVICQTGSEMFMIDQHAAHERFRFEHLKEAYMKKEKLSQMLLSPIILSLDYKEKQTVMENITQFRKLGFELEDFGGNSVIIHGTPIAADEAEVRDLMLEMSDAMQNQIKHPVADFEERALDMIACKYAIKANKRLSIPEMQDLLTKVTDLENAGIKTCPHGRPIKIAFTKTDIEKLFKRKL